MQDNLHRPSLQALNSERQYPSAEWHRVFTMAVAHEQKAIRKGFTIEHRWAGDAASPGLHGTRSHVTLTSTSFVRHSAASLARVPR